MRFQLFIFSSLCLCYVISAFSKQNFVETKLDESRPKRTIILTSIVKKLLWQKFSNFVNLPITRKPPKVQTFTTERNSIPLTTTNPSTLGTLGPSATGQIASGPISAGPSASGPSTINDYTFNGNKNNNSPSTGPDDNNSKQPISPPAVQNYIQTPSSSAGQNYNPNSVDDPRLQQSNGYRLNSIPYEAQHFGPSGSSAEQNYYAKSEPESQSYNPNFGSFALTKFKGDNYYQEQQSNANDPPTGPSVEQNYDPTPSSSAEQNYDPNSVDFPFPGPGGYPGGRNNPKKQQLNNFVSNFNQEKQNYTPFSPYAEQNNVAPPRSEAENYGSSFSFSGSEGVNNNGQNLQGEQQASPSAEQNHGSPLGGVSNSGPKGNVGRPIIKQFNNYEPPSAPSLEQNYGSTNIPEQQNYEPLAEGFSAAAPHYGQQLQQPERVHQSYSNSLGNNRNSVNQLEPKIINSDASRYSGQENSQFNNFQSHRTELQRGEQNNRALYDNEHEKQRDQFSHSNPTSVPFLINYPHHQHYQQLIPSVNKLSNSIQYPDISQNNYQQQQIANHDSSGFNKFNQPLLNFYAPN